MRLIEKFFKLFWESVGVPEPPAVEWKTQTPLILWIGWQRGAQRFMDDHEWTSEQRRRDMVMLHSARRMLYGQTREIVVIEEDDFWVRATTHDHAAANEALVLARQSNIKNGY
jgi:hypothetical protein